VNGTLVRGSDRTAGGPLYDMPADRLTLSAQWSPRAGDAHGWYVGAGSVLVRRQDGVPSGAVYALPTAGYALAQFDAGVRDVPFLARTATMSLSVNNALNARYRDYLSRYRLFVNDPGRDVVLRLTLPL
jgi:iron complex outermembrane receptor protein